MTALYRDFTTQAEIDAEYNAALSVPDFKACARHYVDTSAQARAQIKGMLDVPYGATLDETLDIFPADQPGAPVFVFIHGGYWRSLTSKEFSFVAQGPRALGITTVVVNYSLCPKVSIGEIVRQVRASVAWVLRNIAQYGGDPSRVSVGGHSAGGHLTAMCLQTEWARDYGLPQDPLVGALMVSGLFDLRPLRYSYLQPALQLDEETIQRCSPQFAVRKTATPALVTWGALESHEFARQSTGYAQALSQTGGRAELMPQAGAHHFSAIHGFADGADPLCQWIAKVSARG